MDRWAMKEVLDVAETIPGWMSREELEWLYSQALLCTRIAEIGVHMGRSSWAMAHPGAKLHCVDLWDNVEVHRAFLERYDEFITREIVIPHRGSSHGIAQKIGGVFDLVYIDADHSYPSVRADIRVWAPKVAHGGILAGHDYDGFWPGVVRAVDEAFPLRVRRGPGSIWFVEL